MMAAYDPDQDWDLPSGCRVEAPPGGCPDEAVIEFGSYAEALRAFLGKLGYIGP